jgi:hypothetical protein
VLVLCEVCKPPSPIKTSSADDLFLKGRRLRRSRF